MKKAFAHSIAILMAVLVFYGGAGINIISYCCNDCRTEGIEALINNRCCDIHKHNHPDDHKHHQTSDCTGSSHDNHAEDHNCNATHANIDFRHDHSSGNCCNIERISFDWSLHNAAEQDVDLAPVILDLLSDDILNISPAHIVITNKCDMATPNGPPLVCPRDYLSVLTVLLI